MRKTTKTFPVKGFLFFIVFFFYEIPHYQKGPVLDYMLQSGFQEQNTISPPSGCLYLSVKDCCWLFCYRFEGKMVTIPSEMADRHDM